VVSIETDDHVLRARRTAAWTRAVLGLTGFTLVLAKSELAAHPVLAALGFTTILATASVQIAAPRASWLKIEELLAGTAAVLIVGFGDQRVNVLSVIWLAALTSGVIGRGGRVHWVGRTVVLFALVLPVIRAGQLVPDQAALYVATIGLMLTSGRLTRELNHLLWQARYDADHDDLTGLLSRTAFRGALEVAGAEAGDEQPISLLLLDLDSFEVVNKSLGHAAGDALLASWGEHLRLACGSRDIAGRLGGDEFAMLVHRSDAELLAARLLESGPAQGEDVRQISASVGIAQAPRDGSDAEALLRAADIALRVAKRSRGERRVSTYAGSSLSGRGMQSAREELGRVIEGDGLSMAVQPIVDLRTGAVHAYEALARFGPDGKGAPLHWLSLADELGERDALERACLKAALELFETLPRSASLAVNVSAPVLLDRRTLGIFDEILDLSGLIIEVTEEALVQSDTQLASAVAPLRDRGVRLAVDDMGSGYSGLRQITTVHPSHLKLDRALVTGIDNDPERAALVSALVGYAERVGSLIVAEGIENEDELRVLLELRVPLGQGYFLSRPGVPWPAVGGDALTALGADVAARSDGALAANAYQAPRGKPSSPLRAA
jgi:diguanylate cyclase (GGDEF)-like protein